MKTRKNHSINLNIKVFGKIFENPLFLPSGIIQEISGHEIAAKAGVGTIVLKSVTLEHREGNPIPRVAKYPQGFINSVGLKNPGLKKAKQEIRTLMNKTKTPIIISVFAANVKDFQLLVSEMAELKPTAIELNLSCPNVADEFGDPLSDQADSVSQAVKISKKESKKIPLLAKLSPNVLHIGEIAKAAEAAGADGISAINTVSQGMLIDIKKRKPILGNKQGGVSGPAIKPIAIAKIYEIYKSVKIPILGMGGVTTAEDVIEMMMAGASLVGIGSVVYLKGFGIFKTLLQDVKNYMEKEKIKNISSLIGVAHNK
jgi:dihydroorotate dehydrogenase (NAD+) catalytic subunit